MGGPVRETRAMIRAMDPVMADGRFVFCAASDCADPAAAREAAIGSFREEGGLSLILPLEVARAQGCDVSLPMALISLRIWSALDGVGLTAAVSGTLAGAGIPCNVVAALTDDHLFVPSARADEALTLLIAQARSA